MEYWISGMLDERILWENRKTVEGGQAMNPNQASNFQHPDLRIVDARNKFSYPV
jgi:hypothetical protein